jgi:2-oxoglutarate dehydrogenase E1 component
MTPKSLLRHKLAVSSLAEFGPGSAFRHVIPEIDALVPDEQVKRVVLCSGKVYYDLLQARRDAKQDDVAIIRVEQLYPFPVKSLPNAIAAYRNAEVVWCQEEPENMGAWSFVDRKIEKVVARPGHEGEAARSMSAAPMRRARPPASPRCTSRSRTPW